MRICYLADPQSIHTQRWLNYFIGRGYDVQLITVNKDSIGGATTHYVEPRISNKYLSFFLELKEIKGFVKRIDPDILHAHYVLGYGFYGALTRFEPFVVSAWGSDILISPKRSVVSRLQAKHVLRRANLITCDGENLKEEIARLQSNSLGKVRIVLHGVDVQKFNPRQRDESLREKLGLSHSFVVISTRSLEPVYDVGTLVECMSLVLKKAADIKLVVVGKGSQEPYLRELSRRLGIDDNVIFVGWLPHDELPKYLSLSEVYVSTSVSDGGVAVSTLEAMACGLPVVVTDSGDNRRWIKDGENGFVVPTTNPEALADKIVRLTADYDARSSFGKLNREIVVQKASHAKEMSRMEEIYKELMEKCRS